VCSFRLDGDGYVLATMADGATFELEDARDAVDATWKIAGERRLPVLVDTRGIRAQSRAARQYFMSEEVGRKVSAVAILIDSPVSRVIGSFFLRVGHHHVPTQVFSDEGSARAWLRTMSG
jgi:hypothetical protein